jgi:Tfp pilus assembly protein PilE
LSYVNRAKDAEAQTNLGAIFTDETAFSATNSVYISAGTSSAPAATMTASAVSPTHSFYDAVNTAGAGTYAVDAAPYSCTTNALTANGGNTYKAGVATPYVAGAAKGGFGDIEIKGSDLFILLLPTAFDDAVGSFCLRFY